MTQEFQPNQQHLVEVSHGETFKQRLYLSYQETLLSAQFLMSF